ncbi:hypothetical protein [Neobacillus vireti]
MLSTRVVSRLTLVPVFGVGVFVFSGKYEDVLSENILKRAHEDKNGLNP